MLLIFIGKNIHWDKSSKEGKPRTGILKEDFLRLKGAEDRPPRMSRI